MPRIEYAGRSCALHEGESALDGLLRVGIAVPHACRAGSCGSCLMRAIPPSTPPAVSQDGLKDSWKALGYFLACVCRPDQDIVAGPVGADARVPARIASVEWLSASVLGVRLVTTTPLEYRAGQYITLFREDGLSRSYSIANLPAEDAIELHVRLIQGGRMSQWLATAAAIDTVLQVQGPSGDCFYLAGREDQPILLAGTGTGLAPLFGIARDALGQGHRGQLHFYHGAVDATGLYFQQRLSDLATAHHNFSYTLTTLKNDGPIEHTVFSRLKTLTGWRAFFCGDPAIVQSFKKKAFLAGAALRDIHADAFLPSVA